MSKSGFMSEVYKKKFNNTSYSFENEVEQEQEESSLNQFQNQIIHKTVIFVTILAILNIIGIFSLIYIYKECEYVTNLMNVIIIIKSIMLIIILIISHITRRQPKFNNNITKFIFIITITFQILLMINSNDFKLINKSDSKIPQLSPIILFICCLFYNLYKSRIIKKINERLELKENMNDIHIKYVDSLINKMFCLFFTYTDNDFFYVNNSAKLFLGNTIKENVNINELNEQNDDIINTSKKFFSKLNLTYLNNEINTDINNIFKNANQPMMEIIKYFNINQNKLENYSFYFLGMGEHTNMITGEKYYFNIFIRKNDIGKSSWIEIMMYDITMMKKIESVNAAIKLKEILLSKIAHEFKTPLICVISLSEDIIEDLRKTREINTEIISIKKKIRHVSDLSNYTLFLINDIAQYLNKDTQNLNNSINEKRFYDVNKKEKVEDLKIFLNIQETSIRDILKFSLRILRTLLIYNKNKIQLIKPIQKIDRKIKDLKIFIDPIRLKQIILNLISNAVKFTQIGSITLEAKLEGSNLIIGVIDTGIGIKNEDLKILFQDFNMCDSHLNMNYFGTGLGLSISRNIAKKLGFELKVNSRFGYGSIFYLVINLNNFISNANLKVNVPKPFKSSNMVQMYSQFSHDFKRFSRNEFSYTSFKKNVQSNTNMRNRSESKRQKNSNISVKDKNFSLFRKQVDTKFYQEEKETNFTLRNLYEKNFSNNLSIFGETSISSSSDESIKTLVKKSNFDMPNLLKFKHKDNCESDLIKIEMKPFEKIIKFKNDDNKSNENIILIIDDNTLILDNLQRSLNKILAEYKISNFRVVKKYDGVDLIKDLIEDQKNRNLIKCVFIDQNMEFLNGYEAISIVRRLIKANKIKEVTIVIFTSDDTREIPYSDENTLSISKPANKVDLVNILKLAKIIKNEL